MYAPIWCAPLRQHSASAKARVDYEAIREHSVLSSARHPMYNACVRAEEFMRAVSGLSFGKVLPEARYILRPDPGLDAGNVPLALLAEINRAATAASVDSDDWNLLKLHTREHAITFLVYPNFDTDPHPALASATKINLRTGTIVRTDFRQRANPPILHRKETFLPPDDSRATEFATRTRQEELHDLYREPTKIGLRIHWHALLNRVDVERSAAASEPVPAWPDWTARRGECPRLRAPGCPTSRELHARPRVRGRRPRKNFRARPITPFCWARKALRLLRPTP